MRAAALIARNQIAMVDVPSPFLGPHDVRVRPAAVGVCGTDFHIVSGESNFNLDANGRAIPCEQAPQILGHEITGTVVECGAAVTDLDVGARIVVDQGRSCRSERREPPCEYCASGHSHQCEFYQEHGITGLPGGFAEELVVPAINAVPIDSDLVFPIAAMSEPLACVLHCIDACARARTRYRMTPGNDRVKTAVVLGAGPAGLLFVQVMRSLQAFDGPILLSDPSPHKRALAQSYGAEAVAPDQLEQAVLERSHGRRAEYVVEATGAGAIFAVIPNLIRKQGTLLLYGVGHGGASLALLNPLQWRELQLITSVGASGGFDADGRPSIYRRALGLLSASAIRVESLLSHCYDGLGAVPRALGKDHLQPDYVKGMTILP